MCPSGETCLSAGCCFSELAQLRNSNKANLSIISLKLSVFSPWYSWKIAELALSNKHSRNCWLHPLFQSFTCVCWLYRKLLSVLCMLKKLSIVKLLSLSITFSFLFNHIFLHRIWFMRWCRRYKWPYLYPTYDAHPYISDRPPTLTPQRQVRF